MGRLLNIYDARILVVEDHASTRQIIGTLYLRDYGFPNVDTAADGYEAWQKLEGALVMRLPFHLVVSDWTMPRVDGLALLARLRAHADTKDLPFVLLTCHADRDDVLEAARAGVRHYVTKPFAPEALVSKILEALQVYAEEKTG